MAPCIFICQSTVDRPMRPELIPNISPPRRRAKVYISSKTWVRYNLSSDFRYIVLLWFPVNTNYTASSIFRASRRAVSATAGGGGGGSSSGAVLSNRAGGGQVSERGDPASSSHGGDGGGGGGRSRSRPRGGAPAEPTTPVPVGR